ncbi:MAG: DUF5678 domain-containing protein [Methanosarcinales archaeon]
MKNLYVKRYIPTPEELENIKICKEDSKWLDSLPASEIQKYDGKYVAVRHKKIVAFSDSLKEVYRQLDEQNIKRYLIHKYQEPITVKYVKE